MGGMRIRLGRTKPPFQQREGRSLRVEELDIKRLKALEKVSIHTSNSVYEFSITDPETRTGVLTGGALGESTAIAVLVCSSRGEKSSEARILAVGARAVFLVPCDGRRLVTSQVRELSYSGENQSETRNSVA
jgi:hypothetical protein